jgi:hypothetical protein
MDEKEEKGLECDNFLGWPQKSRPRKKAESVGDEQPEFMVLFVV